MPAFTAAATYIVGATFGAAFAATAVGIFVTSVVAVGLAAVTSRLINGSGKSGGGTAQDQGVRVQLPPATLNKVPVIYGSVYQKGTVTDARISNSNKTMSYILILSEKTQSGVFTVGDIFWNDQKLVFKTGANEQHIVASSIDQNGQGASNSNLSGLVRVRVYAGNTDASSQIFPAISSGNVADPVALLDAGEVKSPANYDLNGLVFALVEIDYNSEKGVTGLAQMTFQIINSLKNPGDVWYDFMTSPRYGAGYPSEAVDSVASIDRTNPLSLASVSNQIPANQFLSDGTTVSTQARYEINGILSTGDTLKNNLDRIGLSSASWTTYDFTQGKWKLVLNRAATTGELNTAFEFNDDNILGEVSVTATNLEDLFNQLEIEYASRKIRDQNDYYRAAIDAGERNQLEPDNTMNLRLDMVNNALHGARIGLIELKGSRADLIITFRADYSAIQCQAGDVVKITNSVYGFTNKLFRLTKIREIEDESGSLSVEVTALEYDSTAYVDETLSDSPDTPGSGVPVFGGSGSLPAPSTPTFSDVNTTTNTFVVRTTIDPTSGPVDEVQWFYSTTSTGGFNYLTNEVSPGGFTAGVEVTDFITQLGNGSYYFRARVGEELRYSDLSPVSDVVIL
jgi:hypothetical protein